MIPPSEPAIHPTSHALQDILNQPEQVSLRRLTALVEYLFRVPVAYMALLDHSCTVATRIGSGAEYWKFLKTYPLTSLIGAPTVIADAAQGLPSGADFGAIRFAASAPLRTSAGLELGLLVIADVQPRPDFSDQDLQALAALAEVLAGKMELRMLAAHAVESELALRETEARFRAMANAAPVLIVYGGADGSCTFVNKTWLEFTGRSLEDTMADSWAADVHPEDRPGLHEAYWRAFQSRQPFKSECRMRRHDGHYRWMLGRGTPRFRKDGAFAGFVGAIVDIEDRRGLTRELQHQKQYTEALAEATGFIYFILGPDGRIEQSGAGCHQASGVGRQDMRGLPLWVACAAARQDALALTEAIRHARTSRTVVRTQPEDESRGTTPAGQSWTIIPVAPDGSCVTTLVAATFESCCGLCSPAPATRHCPRGAAAYSKTPAARQLSFGDGLAEPQVTVVPAVTEINRQPDQ